MPGGTRPSVLLLSAPRGARLRGRAMSVREVTPQQAHELLDSGYRYVDVRTEAEFAAGHPAGAVNVPVVLPDPTTRQMVMNRDFTDVVTAHFPKDAPLVVGCQSGMRSQRAAEFLLQAGFMNVVNMAGGFGGARDQAGNFVTPGWSQCGLPMCTTCAPQNSYAGMHARLE